MLCVVQGTKRKKHDPFLNLNLNFWDGSHHLKMMFNQQRILVATIIAINYIQLAGCFVNISGAHSSEKAQQLTTLSARDSSMDGRRKFLKSIVTTIGTTTIVISSTIPSVANAKNGDSSNIVLPNYIEYLIEKNAEGQPRDYSYKGPDAETQLRRIGEAGNRLPEIAALAEEKKWSQVQGIITGPLGTLLQTMNSVVSIAGTKEAKDAAKLVKTDLLEIGAAAGRKESASCIKAADNASKDLQKFVMIAFKAE